MISLPEKLKLTCVSCRRAFFVFSTDISRIERIGCPFCECKTEILEMLDTELRLLIYRELREAIENKAMESSQTGQ